MAVKEFTVRIDYRPAHVPLVDVPAEHRRAVESALGEMMQRGLVRIARTFNLGTS